MKKIIFSLLVLSLIGLISCKGKSYNKVTITPTDTTKLIQVEVTTVTIDTFAIEVSKELSDSLILERIKFATDSLKKDNVRRDSLHRINFLKMTKIINGGYNGLSDREKIWNKAKEVLNDTI